MPHYTLAPYTGTGRYRDPFRPAVDPESGWTAIDLRPDPARPDGFALVTTPGRTRGLHLGDEPQARSSVVRRLLGNRLGVSLRRDTLPQHAAALLIEHAREDGTRWKPLRPTRTAYEIWLGGLLWRMPILAGGVTYSESFNTADSSTLGPDLTWAETNGNPKILSNSMRSTAADAGDEARAQHDTATVNMFVQATVAIKNTPTGVAADATVCARFATTERNYYAAQFRITTAAVSQRRLSKLTANGTVSTDIVALTTQAWVATDVSRLEVDGSTLRHKLNGTVLGTPSTDTTIATGTRAGLFLVSGTTTPDNDVGWDTFSFGDLDEPRVRASAHYRRRRVS